MQVVGKYKEASRPVKRRVAANVAIFPLLATIAFACGPEDDTVPVDMRVGYDATRSSEQSVTEIYEYANPRSQRTDFRVTKAPPLRFAFPAAYYANGPSISGGPVAVMELAFDRDTWKPYSTALPGRRRGEPKISREEDRDRRLRFLQVGLYSNLMPSGWVPGKSQPYLGPFEEIGSFDGFKLFSYQGPSDRAIEPLAPIVFDGIDFNGNNTIVGIDEASEGKARHLLCWKRGRCLYYFIYKGRHVKMTINKSELPDAREMETKLTEVLNEHRLTDDS